MIKQENGIISLFQGDSGTIRLDGFNPEHNYMVYLQFSDEDGNFIGEQMEQETGYSDTVSFFIPASVTDKLIVEAGEDYSTFYLGGKRTEIVENIRTLYAWYNETSEENIYTLSDVPAVDDVIYTADNEPTEDEVTAVTVNDEDEVTSITVDDTVYTRNEGGDIQIVLSTSYSGEDTIIPEMSKKKVVIVYRKVAEGPN